MKRSGRRLDWRIHILIHYVLPFYKHKDYLKSIDFWDYHKQANKLETSLEKSQRIHDSNWHHHETDPNVYWVHVY